MGRRGLGVEGVARAGEYQPTGRIWHLVCGVYIVYSGARRSTRSSAG
ncbi:MAG: hypothetical protein MJE68_27080 [Proteobacteria bacterium]|nr:hypothetical protein [Pseudomonadota bacterium]